MRIINRETLHAGAYDIPCIRIEGSDTNRYSVYGVIFTAKSCTYIRICRFRCSTWSGALERGREVVKHFHLFKEIFWELAKEKACILK